MMWRRTDYHGSREYGEDRQSAAISQVELTVAWLLDAVRRRLDAVRRRLGSLARLAKLMGPSRTTLKILNHRGFTLLGLPNGAPGAANEAAASRDR